MLSRHLREAVNHLTKSLSDFAEVLNQTGFDNILTRYEKDLENFAKILNEIDANNGTVSSENLEQVKIIEQLFFEDETDLMKTVSITAEQAETAGTVMETLQTTENLTDSVIAVIEEALENQDTATNNSNTADISTSQNNTAQISTSQNETIDTALSTTTVVVSVISTSDEKVIETTTETVSTSDGNTTEISTSVDNTEEATTEIESSSENVSEVTTEESADSTTVAGS